jgi:hypothetical protein
MQCIVKCSSDKDCSNAVHVCKKYKISQGCSYVFIRNKGQHAILKRSATVEELLRYSQYCFHSLLVSYNIYINL